MAQEDKRLKRRVRTSYFISTVSIAMVLFLLGTVAWMIVGALGVTNRLKESIAIYVMLDDGLSDDQTQTLKLAIEFEEAVREVVYVPKEIAAERFIAESGEDFRTFIDVNPLPDSFEVGFRAQSSDRSHIEAFARTVEAMKGVDEVMWQKGVIEQMGVGLGKVGLVVVLFGGALLLISFILLRNTVFMTVMAKLRIINTMKLVGASGWFIMRPFVASAALHGAVAGVIATAMFGLAVVGVSEGVPELALVSDRAILWAIPAGMILLGVAISVIFTALAVSRAVRQPSSKAYI